MDVENFSQGSDMWGTRIPRLDPPVRAGTQQPDPLGGTSGAIFPYPTPEGEHGFAFPGGLTDTAIKACQRGEMPNMDPQQCSTLKGSTFDVGFFMFNTLGKYFKAAGKTVDFQLCNSSNDCSEFAPTPEARDVNQLR
jgi:hypothetical protein